MRGPGLRLERGGAGERWGSRCTHHGPDQGPISQIPTSRTATGPPRWDWPPAPRIAARRWMHAARAKSGQSAPRSLDGRVRERVDGTHTLHSTAPVILTRAGHCKRGPGSTERTRTKERTLGLGVSVRDESSGLGSPGAERHLVQPQQRLSGVRRHTSIASPLRVVCRRIRTPCTALQARVEPMRQSGPEGQRGPGA